MTQTISVFLCIGLAILFLLRHFWKMFFQKKDSCAGCGISKAMKTKI